MWNITVSLICLKAHNPSFIVLGSASMESTKEESNILIWNFTCAGSIQLFLMFLLLKQSKITTTYTAFAFCWVLYIIWGWSEVPRGMCTGWMASSTLFSQDMSIHRSRDLHRVLGPTCCGYWGTAILCCSANISKDGHMVFQIVFMMSVDLLVKTYKLSLVRKNT